MATFAPPSTPPVSLTEHNANISRVPYLPGLDGMRALAVVAVMLYHANSSWLPGGFLGVEMFFVISGYLITLLIIAERERTYRVSLRDFWMRRARRLLPALFLLLFLVTVWTALFERDALGALRGDVIAGVFYSSNWYQLWVGLGYTAEADFAPLRHLWSLAVEEQFYLIWPLVMVVLLRRRGSRRVADASRWLFLASLTIAVVVALLYHPGPIEDPVRTPEAYWWIGERPIGKMDFLYIGTFSRLSGILLGAALAMVWRPFAVARGPLAAKGRWFDLGALAALVGLGVMCWNVYLRTPSGTADRFLFQGGMFLASALTAVVIVAISHPAGLANRVLGNPVFVWIGVRSYGLYLYHWPIYQIMRDVAGNKLRPHEFVVAMAITAVVTELSYRFVETPIRTGRARAALARLRVSPDRRPRRLLVGLTAVCGALGLFAGAALATADVKQNEVAASLDEAEEFTTDLSALDLEGTPTTRAPATSPAPTTVEPTTAPAPTTDPAAAPLAPTTVADDPAVTTAPSTSPVTTAPPSTAAPTTVPTTAPVVPATTAPPSPPPTQLGVVTDLSDITPLQVPPADHGLRLVALGDSVMLGAAEELAAKGFQVDAVKSRQFTAYLPEMQVLADNRTFGSAVVVHLGTNGSFSQASLDSMMGMLRDVPVVVFLTGKADRSWVAGNNAMVRALPASYPNVTVLDWEVIGSVCGGPCFYDDDIHLNQTGQDFYTNAIATILGL